MSYERLLNRSCIPTNQDIVETIGEKSGLWSELYNFLIDNYDFNQELAFSQKIMDGQFGTGKAKRP
ncbi:MAG: hypothetical protein GY790_12855 [Bacteroidetes bacterium]|nr:hypothetical protein [Bacteroidota bacterium]